MNQHDFIGQLIQYVLSMIPGAGPLLSQLLGPGVASWLSPSGSMSNKFIWPSQGQSMGEVTMGALDRMRSSGFSYGASQFQQEQAIRALSEYNKMLHPDWSDDDARGAAENMASNPFNAVGFLYDKFDPLGAAAGASAAGEVAAILHRRGSDYSLEGATYAKSISNLLYGSKGQDGKYQNGILNDILDNPGKYGNLSAAGVMGLAKELALTDRTGFSKSETIEDKDGKKVSRTTFDSERFKRRLEEVSSAISPWTDIFGKDIPKLLNQLESLTGTGLGTSSADIHTLGHRMTSIMATTGARIQHIAAYKDALSKSLVDPEMSNRSILGAAALAGDLTLGLSNFSMNSMTNQEIQSTVSRYYAGTAKSTYADRFSLAYAKWSADNPDGSIEDFKQALRVQMKGGADHQAALLSVSGARSIHDLEKYRNTDAFLKSNAMGEGMRMTREVDIEKSLQFIRNRYDKNLSAYNDTVGSRLQNMSSEDLIKFLSMSVDDQAKAIMDWDSNLTKDQALTIRKDIGALSASATDQDNDNSARAIFGTAYNELRQGRRAKQVESFNRAVERLRGPGGFVGVFQELKKSEGTADVSKLLKSFTGGVDVLEPIMEMFTSGKFTEDEVKKHDEMLKSGTNFAVNNYMELGEGGAYEDIGDMMRNKDKDTVLKGYRLASALNAIGSSTLSKVSESDREAIITTLKEKINKDMSQKDIADTAKDIYIDSRLKAGIGSVDGLSSENDGETAKKILADLVKGQHTSRESYLKAYKEQIKDRSEKDQKELLSDFNKIWGASKVGDIDGIDPIQRMLGVIEQLPELFQKLITALKNKSGNG